MSRSMRTGLALLALALAISACAGSNTTGQAVSAPSATPTAVPTSAPTSAPTTAPTAIPIIAADVRVAGVDVGGLTVEAARAKIEQELAGALQPLQLQAGEQQVTITAQQIDLQIRLDELLAEAQQAISGARIGLKIRFDEARLRAAIDTFGQTTVTAAAISVITETDNLSRSFALEPGQRVDLDAAVKQISERLNAPGSPRQVTLTLTPDQGSSARPTPEQLQEQLQAMADKWKGVVGLYIYDLADQKPIATLNENSVFSGASVMKVPILLHAYANLETFSTKQEEALKKMIVESDNKSANAMLSASVGGAGTEAALKGVLQMTRMLRDLGLEHTYQYTPYEATEYLSLKNIKLQKGPKVEGPKPYTDADPRLRTTPAEMSRIFLWISQCSQGQGPLLDKFGDKLNAARCQEMIDRLEQNGDRSRMVAGLPKGTRVAHKSGWIEDMQADVGIVRSPGGDYLAAIYVYREIIPGKNYLSDVVAAPVIADFSRLVYSYYNPVLIGE